MFNIDREYEVEELETVYEVPYEVAQNISELRKIKLDDKALVLGVLIEELSSKEQKADASGVVFEAGMSLYEFLTKNPHIRTVNELTEYYDMSVIKKAERNGVFLTHRNKIAF
jgi:hypothetical protein